MYFIFDLTGAPCQCTVLINRVGSPERSSLSPILFQQSWGSVQSWREVLRLQEHRLEVSLCVWRSSSQQTQNTASIQGSHCAHECISTFVRAARFLSAIPMKTKAQSHMYCTYMQVHKIYHCKHTGSCIHTHTHTVTYCHTHTHMRAHKVCNLSSISP